MKTPTIKLEMELTSDEYFDLLSAIGTRGERLQEWIEKIPGQGDKSERYSSASELERLTEIEAKVREAHTKLNMPTLYAMGVRL